MVIASEQLGLYVVANAVYKVNLEERLSSYEVEDYRLFGEVVFMVENVVDGSFGSVP